MKRFINKLHRPNLTSIGLSLFLGFCFAGIFKDHVTPILLVGKTYFGRSLLVKLLILFGQTVIYAFLLLSSKSIFSLIPNQKFQCLVSRLSSWINDFVSIPKKPNISWHSLGISFLLSNFAYFFPEWLFVVTKRSFLTFAPFIEKLSILGLTISLMFSVSTAFLLISFIIFRNKYNLSAPKYLLVFPSLILSLSLLLLVDNFTHTIFSIGIITTNNVTCVLYIVFLFTSTVIIWKDLIRFSAFVDIKIKQATQKQSKGLRLANTLMIVFLLISPFLFLSRFSLHLGTISSRTQINKLDKKPHIVLITADGVNANNMSVYGYERNTTPFLTKFSRDALFIENVFANSAHTSGSLTSILTSKYPTTTRVLYPPDILRSDDAYQHLPGILKSHGYQTTQYSVPYYADAYQLNFLEGFDMANGRSRQNSNLFSFYNSFLDGNTSYYLFELTTRLTNRLSHIFFLENMSNTFKQITESMNAFDDYEKFTSALSDLTNAPSPQFIHIHTMKTHGDRFYPATQVFSAGQDIEGQNAWSTDFYDDAILEFDQYFANFWEQLNQLSLENNTIIVVASDHAQKFSTIERIPLLIKFPNNDYSGKILTNVQNLDIAPTILDYLDIEIPEWMSGQSLIKKEEINYPIIAVGTNKVDKGSLFEPYITPPFYQFSFITIIDCHKWYRLDLDKLSWSNGMIKNYQDQCTDDQLLPFEKVADVVINRLLLDGFDLNEDTLTKIRTLSQ